jgi:predicted transcriptional regulator
MKPIGLITYTTYYETGELRPIVDTIYQALGKVTDAEQALLNRQRALAAAVTEARKNRATWKEIGDTLGITRQSAQQHYGQKDDNTASIKGHLEHRAYEHAQEHVQ